MARGQLLDPITGEKVDGSRLMADPDRRDLPYVFTPDGTKAARSPANRMLLSKEHGRAVRIALASHLNETAALETHGINEKARLAILSKSLDDFVRAREAELERQEKEFLERLQLRIGDDINRSDEEVDIDE